MDWSLFLPIVALVVALAATYYAWHSQKVCIEVLNDVLASNERMLDRLNQCSAELEDAARPRTLSVITVNGATKPKG